MIQRVQENKQFQIIIIVKGKVQKKKIKKQWEDKKKYEMKTQDVLWKDGKE